MQVLLACLAGIASATPPPPDDVVKMFEEHTFVYTGGDYQEEPFKWRLLKPAKIEADKKYPVILFLHGAGERGDDGVMQLKHFPVVMATSENQEKYPCFLIAPQCRSGKKWSNVNWHAQSSEPMPAEPSEQMKVALGILDQVLAENPCDLNRVYLTGLSMGGYGSWDLAERSPERFAAVAPICGGGDDQHADRLAPIPIWAWHGDQDPAVPVVRSREMIAAIEKAGGHPKYTELPGVGHESWVQAYGDPSGLIPWMFEQKRGQK
jgi:predicted peptidase